MGFRESVFMYFSALSPLPFSAEPEVLFVREDAQEVPCYKTEGSLGSRGQTQICSSLRDKETK